MAENRFSIMVNGSSVNTGPDETVLAACARAGWTIPVLCQASAVSMPPAPADTAGTGRDHSGQQSSVHANDRATGLNHGSCMVCVVEDTGQGMLIPACSTNCRSGMRIITDSEKVMESRRQALELLLSEHTGDCHAPCTLACPEHLPVPAILYQVGYGSLDKAVAMLPAAASFRCQDCDAPCMRACRRKQLDHRVDVRSVLCAVLKAAGQARRDEDHLYSPGSMISDQAGQPGQAEQPEQAGQPEQPEQPLQHTGRFMVDRSFMSVRSRDDHDIFDDAAMSTAVPDMVISESAFAVEARRCLECDCLKSGSCLLRSLSARYAARRNGCKGAKPPLLPRVRRGEPAVHEPGKCIKCGNCVQITRGGPGEFIFVGKGYDQQVAMHAGGDLHWAVRNAAVFCPTGALAIRAEDTIP
jgi:ferredoxin